MQGVSTLVLALATLEQRFVLYSSEDGTLGYWFAGEPAVPTLDPPGNVAKALALPAVADLSPPLKPHGLCVDNIRNGLYVIDADPTRMKILRYTLTHYTSATGVGASVTASDPYPVVSGLLAQWCAVDGVGNLFFSTSALQPTENDKGSIFKVPASLLVAPQPDAAKNFLQIFSDASNPGVYTEKYNGKPLLVAPLADDPVMSPGTAGAVYPGANFASVSQPTGIAVDNFRAYWGNMYQGLQKGSVVSGLYANVKSMTRNPLSLAINADEVHGVCLSSNNVFYTARSTDAVGYLYAVRKTGGPIAEVNQGFMNPRGCAHDGDGTLYVADQGGEDAVSGDVVKPSVWRLAGNMRTLSTQRAEKAFDLVDASNLPIGIAVYQPPAFSM